MNQKPFLMQEWIRLGHRFRHIRWDNLFQTMSRSDFFVMNMIYRYQEHHPEIPGIYASMIAERAHVSRAAVSRQLQQLEERGWIARKIDPSSKRNAFVYLTEEGASVVRRQHTCSEQFFDRVFSRVGRERMEEMLQTLDEIADAMETELRRCEGSQNEDSTGGVCR